MSTLKVRRTKLLEAAMAVLQAAPAGQLNIVVLNKALFYLDLLALRDLGRLVTDQTYVALPNGPVVDQYKDVLIAPLKEAHLAEQLLDGGMAKPLRVLRSLEVYTALTASEARIASVIGAGFNSFTSITVSSYSHDNPGWIAARRHAVDGRPAPRIDMRLALQQLVDDDVDSWIDDPLDDSTRAACEAAATAVRVWE